MHQERLDTACQPVSVGVAPLPRARAPWDEESWHYNMSPAVEETHEDVLPRDHRDLCSICTYASQCMYCGTRARPKLQCELFDVDVKTFAAEPETATNPSEENNALGAGRGLCYTCENRKDCAIRMREGAVWHCEEYC